MRTDLSADHAPPPAAAGGGAPPTDHRPPAVTAAPALLAGALVAAVLLASLQSASRAGPPPPTAAIAALEYARVSDTAAYQPYFEAADPAIRRRVLLALGRVTPPGAVAPVAELLADPDPGVRRLAAFALGQFADTTAVTALVRTAHSDSIAEVAEEALYALGKVGGRGTAPRIATFLDQQAAALRGAAALALARMADSTQVGRLLERLTSETEPDVLWKLARAVEATAANPELLAALAPHLESPAPAVRAATARALGKLGDAHAVRPLLALLVDGEWRVRVEACRALGLIGSAAAVEALTPLLADPVPHVREAAVTALGGIGGAATLEVRAALDDPVIGVRRAVAAALAEAPAAADSLRDAVLRDLRRLLADPAPAVGAAALGSLGALEGTGALDLLVDYTLPGTPAPLRVAAVTALGELGEPVALSVLVDLLADDDWVVATVAAGALGELGDDAAQSSLLEAYTARTGFEGFDVRLACVEALARLGNRRSRGLLHAALGDRDPRLRSLAHAALDSIAARAGPDSAATWSVEDSLAAAPAPGGARLGRAPADFPLFASTARRALIITERGTIEIQLLADAAPNTVESFARLAARGFYEHGVFHRVVPDFVVQGGCPRHDGWGGPGYALRSEWNPERYGTGTVGMAHAGKDTPGSQFFITHSPQPHLDGRYTVFGRVVKGMQVVDAIQQGDSFSVRILP